LDYRNSGNASPSSRVLLWNSRNTVPRGPAARQSWYL